MEKVYTEVERTNRLPLSRGFRFVFGSQTVWLLALVFVGMGPGSLGSVWAQADTQSGAFFENRIRPILVEHCYPCHSTEAKKAKGGLKLDSREDFLKGGIDGPIVIPGSPEQSRLIRSVKHLDPDLKMPPPGEGGKKLPDNKIADLTQWVKDGAPYPVATSTARENPDRPWSLEPLKAPASPKVRDGKWAKTSIDPFILTRLEARGLKPSPPADKKTLIRRATYDLTGLPPTPEEILQFEADNSPGAFAKVVDRLLASPRYGEHWGRHWLDVVRYADTAGDTADYPLPEAWRYRNYVIDSFNADKPYDQFLQEQIAGDILARQGPTELYAERVAATGFLALSRRFGFDSENYHHLTIQDTIDTLGQSVLGLTLGCARCHDHKFDPVSMRDYYGLYGIFDSTRYAFPGSEQKGKFRALVPLVPSVESQAKWRELQTRFVSTGNQPVSILRSLDDLDGDFEMQKIAAGGSNGVLVPPWFYEGKVSVTQAGQSPFKNLYAFGGVGVSVAPNAGEYEVKQRVHPSRTSGLVYFNLDFKVATNPATSKGSHRLLIGAQDSQPIVEVLISQDSISFGKGTAQASIPLVKPGEWQSLQLALDLSSRTFEGTVGIPGNLAKISKRSFEPGSGQAINFFWIGAKSDSQNSLPGLDFDNFTLQDTPVPPVSASPTDTLLETIALLEKLRDEVKTLSGLDGDFEGQKAGTPPALPFHPGPNSGVKIIAEAQSPFSNLYPAGKLGLNMPWTPAGGYNGFGLHLPKPWTNEKTSRLHLAFDFRCQNGKDAIGGASGTWRFQLGRSHTSPAVELAFDNQTFFARNGNAMESVAILRPGEWHQIAMDLDLKNRKYTATLSTGDRKTEFSGLLASGWVGAIDYAFIDSGGNIPGAKPAIDTDNFFISENAPNPFGKPLESAKLANQKQKKIQELNERIGKLSAQADKWKKELETDLAKGPVPLAYGVSEGTPHASRIQIRGEPDRPGAVVQRGFIKVLGKHELNPESQGSGRLELARWLTRPDNPLTPRVMANRIWQYHFGRGLVSTPNDFGTRSQPPTHPELLDHLANALVKNGWSIKSMHRLILLSATWQQSATGKSPETTELYGTFPRRRLSAEEIRDSILWISGTLDSVPGKEHPFPPATTWGYSQHAPFGAVYDHDKRSVYLMVQRLKRHPFLALFDGADPNSSTAQRGVTTVPTQALYFLNDPLVHAKAQSAAQRIRASAPNENGQIELSYQLVLARPATDLEKSDANGFLARYRAELIATGIANPDELALASFIRTLLGSNEFLYCD